jgi:hypothetical protein
VPVQKNLLIIRSLQKNIHFVTLLTKVTPSIDRQSPSLLVLSMLGESRSIHMTLIGILILDLLGWRRGAGEHVLNCDGSFKDLAAHKALEEMLSCQAPVNCNCWFKAFFVSYMK